jgi:hypothetical protein
VANPTLHLHFYLPITGNYSVSNFVDYLRGPVDVDHPFDRWEDAGVNLDFKSKAVSGTADFKTSLQDTDSVVVYLGHSVLDFKNKRSLGLSPLGHETAEIAPDALMSLLKASKAKLVILATCASSTCVGKLTAGPAVVVTNSGSNLTTWSFDWAHALTAFLLLLIDYEVGGSGQPVARNKGRATISDALDASNVAFKNQKTTDRFELAFGKGSTVVFPSSP